MRDEPLYIAFLWHMHQPYYKDLVTGEYVMPWVRLHATKDYYSMVSILDDFPQIKQTFNIVPSLLVQTQDYVENGAEDNFLRLSRKDAESLTPDEKIDILHNFFMANWDNMVRIYPRYEDLLEKRGRHTSRTAIRAIAGTFSPQDFQDLQVWFNLVWINAGIRSRDSRLKQLVEKGGNFSTPDKQTVLDVQQEIVAKTIDKYREVAARGQIELTTSPFYHPIMPLLCDAGIASVARPDLTLPKLVIRHPEDVDEQLRRAVETHTECFGQAPRGLWPSEGSVSEEIVPIIAKHRFSWIASDEDVLTRSLGKDVPSDAEARFNQTLSYLYQPYWVRKDDAQVAVVFRDKVLSDNIGFVYHRWPAEKAVDDFITSLRRIKHTLGRSGRAHLVPIILDGENAWECYAGDGQQFLRMLYERLEKEEGLETIRISDFIERFPPAQTLPELWPGSWINHDFDVWIGGKEENMAWQLLEETRSALEIFTRSPESEEIDEDILNKAWEEIYISEGSDWNWWYGRHHTSASDEVFDNLYRKHLRNVYQLTGKPLPETLFDSIIVHEAAPLEEPIGIMTPAIDGKATNYYEWLPAGLVDVKTRGGVMHQAESFVSRIYYGFDAQNLYVRVDNAFDWAKELRGSTQIRLSFLAPQPAVVSIFTDETAGTRATLRLADSQDNENGGTQGVLQVALDSVVEIGVPFALLKAGADAEVKFFVVVERDGLEIERWPTRGPIALVVPTKEFELVNWYL